MLLQKEKLQHLNSIAHEGKVVVFGTDAEGDIHYTIKQDGFEDSYLNTPADQRTGWEQWKQLEFPNEAEDDASVVEKETEEFTRQDNGEFLIRSRYRTQNESAVAPVQLVSGVGHIYVFRQSKQNTLLVDRFVLDGMTNELTRKLEVRFKRSRQKYKPTEDMKMGASGLQNVDSLDYRDTDNEFFYEPTTELKLIDHLHKGWFSVVQVPTNEHDKYRWHIFAYNSQSQKVQLTTIRASEEGLFDLKDYTVLEPKSDTDTTLVPRSIPGIIQRTLDINGVRVTNGLAATKYDIQQEQETKAGPQLIRTSSKVMLGVPTDQGTAALSFAIAADGTLSQIDETPQTDVLRSTQRDVLLPLNTLDEIKAIGDTTPPPQGTITGFSVGTEEDGAEDLVKISSPEAVNLVSGDLVEIQNTIDYNGLYQATKIDEDTFTIELPATQAMGTWETVEEEGGLIFDGMVMAYEKTADGKLKVTASNHGLEDGDQVLLTGTQDYNNTYPIQKIDDANFVIQRQWSQSEAVNVKLESHKRRGIILDGNQDYIDCGKNINLSQRSFTIELWAKRDSITGQQLLIAQGEGKPNHALLIGFRQTHNFFMAFWENAIDTPTQYSDNNWHHWACTYDNQTKTQTVYCDGKLVTSRISTSDTFAIGNFYIGCRFGFQDAFNGCIADVRIWDIARTEKEIQDSMYLQLTGKEVGLVGYWRLGAISEGKERKVVDFSVNANHGIVHGDAYVGGVTLNRNLRDGMPAVKYSNDELVAVSQRATYIEEFEFKVDPEVDVNNADGNGNKIFQLSYWGKTSRSADDKIEISAQQDNFETLGKGWYRTTCRFTIPDGVAMLRTFEIANIRGTWNSLEIRKHHIRLVSDAITEAKSGDSVSLKRLAETSSNLKDELKTLEQKEREESTLLEEKSELEKLIALLEDAAKLDAAIAVKQSEVNAQRNKINKLQTAVTNTYNNYQDEKNNPLNYWCKFVCRARESWIIRVYTNNNQLLYADIGANGNPYYSNNQFKFERVDGGYYRIVCMSGNKVPILTENKGKLYAKSFAEIEILAQVYSQLGLPQFIKECQEWKFKKQSNGYYIIENRFTKEVWDWATSEFSVLVWPENGGTNQQWKIVKIGGETNNNISQARQTWEKNKNELQEANKRLTRLQEELDILKSQKTGIGGNKAELEQRLKAVIEQIQKVRNALSKANTNFINGVKQNQQTASVMSQLAQDSSSLTTQGALLGFVNPTCRLNAIATCEGNVQLSYFDDQGQMRQTLYDATSDSLNTTFEQWIPDNLRTCLNFNHESSVLKLNNPIYLTGNSTVEAWFFYPFTEKLHWHVLASSSDDQQQIVAYNGKYLGLRINGVFFDSGYDLEKLSTGWHHLAIATKQQEKTSRFYIDGEKVGVTQAKPALQIDGKQNLVSLPEMNVDYSVGFTIEAWVNYASLNDSRMIDLGTESSSASIVFGNKANTDTLLLTIDGRSVEAPEVLETQKWMHLAATVDGYGNVALYKDGEQISTAKASVPANINRTQNYIGSGNWLNDGNWDGEIAEVRLWNVPRTETEIKANLGKTLKGDELGLVGYWQFAEGRAQDSSPKGYDGTIKGTVKSVDLLAKLTSGIYSLGNIAKPDSVSQSDAGTLSPHNAPPVTNGLKVYLSGESLTSDRWQDLSGNQNHATKAYNCTMASSHVVSDYNGKQFTVARFTSSGGAILPDSFRLNKPFTAIIIDRYYGNTKGRTLQSRDNNWLLGKWGGNNGCFMEGWLDNYPATVGEFTLSTVTLEGTSPRWYTDGKLHKDSGGTTAPGRLGFCKGGKHAEVSQADIACVLIYDRVLSKAEQQQVEAWLGDRYGISIAASNTALKLNGSNDYVEIPYSSALNTNEFTVSFWVKLTGGTGHRSPLTSRDDYPQGGYIFYASPNNQWQFWVGTGSRWDVAPANSNIILNTWTHLAATVQGNQLKLYVNGKLEAEKTVSNYRLNTACPLRIGAGTTEKDPNYLFPGEVAEVRIWNKTRTQAEIERDMTKALTGNEPGLAGYWPLRDGSAQDYSPNSNNGSIKGNPQTVPFDKVQLPATTSNTATTTIKETNPNANHFGKLAEVRIWGIGLSDEEIAVNSKTVLSGNEPGLLAYYPITEATGNEVRDRSGNNRHGTMQGASWWGCAAPIGNLGHTVMQFDGKNDYIKTNLDAQPSAMPATTWEAWVKPAIGTNPIDGGWQMILCTDDGGWDRFVAVKDSQFQISHGSQVWSATVAEVGQWQHIAVVYLADGSIKFYKNGREFSYGAKSTIKSTTKRLELGRSPSAQQYFLGQLAEVRIWNLARTPEEIQATMHQYLTGEEAGLVGYWPLNTITPEGATSQTPDLTGNHPGTVHEAILAKDNTLPISGDALVSSEYNTITIDPATGRKSAIMRRFFASPALNGAKFLPEKRIEQLQLQWIGNAQFAPTLLGYIEGAPPIPTENLTVQPDYNGATSVELNMSEDVDFSWNRAQDSGLGASAEFFLGGDTEGYAGKFYFNKALKGRSGFKGSLDFSYQFLNESNITSSSSNSMSDRLELRGTPEQTVKFPHLGKRFIPKNVGYALVISGLADVFITKLSRSGKMVGYDVRPVDGIPPDVNTITFLINPAYTMNGSLDGMTGSSATSDRFFQHVPQMRSQYGSLYPASYYRLQEAYNLKQAIEREDKRRESYFQQFNARLLDETSLSREMEGGAAPESISIEREEDKANTNLSEEEQKAAEEAKMQQMKEQMEADKEKQSAAVKQKRAEIDTKIADQEKRAHATDSFAGWQKKMENLLIRSGKRNIVNTYVWDGDGGMRTEAQSFASTAEHTIGGSFTLNAGLGLDMIAGSSIQVELTALATVNMTQTMSKTESRSKGIELNVDLSGVEHVGITDYKDYPIQPGEKVDRYRFMSFYLEGSTNNFYDFFNDVVDPEWLRSNDEEARALRQAMGKANKTWRVLHRVTYVERPALMGFGRDLRRLQGQDQAADAIVTEFQQLALKQLQIEDKLDMILNYLAQKESEA